MQAKLLFKQWIRENHIRPMEVDIEEEGHLDYIPVELKENTTVSVLLESNDPNATLEIYCYDRDGLHEVPVRKELFILDGTKVNESLVPGDYAFRVRSHGEISEGLYRVLPKNMSREQLTELRDYLESICTGLSLNILRKASGTALGAGQELYNEFQVLNYLRLNYNTWVRTSLEAIGKDPITDIEKQYEERLYSQNPDTKSQRWLQTKGMARNASPYFPAVVYEKHAVSTFNTVENRRLKVTVKRLHSLIRKLEESYGEGLDGQIQKYNEKLGEIARLEERIIKASRNFLTEELAKSLTFRRNLLQQEVTEKKDYIEKIREHRKELKYKLSNLSEFLYSDWLKAVPSKNKAEKVTQRFLKDRRYRKIYRFYRELKEQFESKMSFKNEFYPYEPTSKLYELYILTLVIHILQQKGFNWESGWLADFPNNPLLAVGSLEKDTTLLLKKGDYTLEVGYDIFIGDDLGASNKPMFLSQPGTSCRPDVHVSLFKNGELITSMVFEVKYKKFRNIFVAGTETKDMRQARGYLAIDYLDPNRRNKPNRWIVKKAVVVYPKDENAPPLKTDYYGGNIQFLQIEPTDPRREEKPFGYDNFEGFIDELLTEA